MVVLTKLGSSTQQLRRRGQAMCIEHSLPARIMGEIPARHSAKTYQPALETAVPRIHVLDVDGAACPHTGLDIHGLVRDAGVRTETPVRCGGIADQQRIRCQDRQQAGGQLRCRHLSASRVKVEGLPAAVARHQQAVVLAMEARS